MATVEKNGKNLAHAMNKGKPKSNPELLTHWEELDFDTFEDDFHFNRDVVSRSLNASDFSSKGTF